MLASSEPAGAPIGPITRVGMDYVLSPRERAWLANQQKKALGARSKYVPHQGKRELQRRVKRTHGGS